MSGSKGKRPALAPNSEPQQRQITTVAAGIIKSGPLPPPEDIARYNEIIPNGAERILRMAEEQQQHRMALEKCVIFGDSRRAWAGLAVGGLLSLAFLGCGVWLIASGHEWAGTTIATVDLASVVGVFVIGQRSRQKERVEKAQIMTRR